MNKYRLLLVILLLQACTTVAPPTSLSTVPPSCRTDCVTSFGELLGTTEDHVPAYSNCQPQCVALIPHQEKGVYTGIQWQCVEFARRWLFTNKGVVYGDVDVAADIWHKIATVAHVSDGKKFPLRAIPNGSTEPPQVGDLLIYAREFLDTGHVAVVVGIDPNQQIIEIAEQNFSNQHWPGHYARKLKFVKEDGKYWLLETYLLGWKRLTI